MKNILFIVGSLRKGSFNHQLAEEAEKMLAGKANVSSFLKEVFRENFHYFFDFSHFFV